MLKFIVGIFQLGQCLLHGCSSLLVAPIKARLVENKLTNSHSIMTDSPTLTSFVPSNCRQLNRSETDIYNIFIASYDFFSFAFTQLWNSADLWVGGSFSGVESGTGLLLFYVVSW